MLEICSKYARNMLEICAYWSHNAQNMLNMLKICLKYARNMLEICSICLYKCILLNCSLHLPFHSALTVDKLRSACEWDSGKTLDNIPQALPFCISSQYSINGNMLEICSRICSKYAQNMGILGVNISILSKKSIICSEYARNMLEILAYWEQIWAYSKYIQWKT